MAEGTIRIVREPTQGTGDTVGRIDVSDTDINIPTTSRRRNAQSRAASDRAGNSETQRTTLSVEDRGNENQSVTDSHTGRRTPAPSGRRTPSKPTYMGVTESKQTAEYLVSAVEMVGVMATGPVGEMTGFERGIITPPVARILARTPLEIVGKFNPLIDGAAVVLGLGMYISRIAAGIKGQPKQNQPNIQEDTAAPISAQPSSTVTSTRAGDVDGIAPPVPNVIREYMNGSM